MRRYHRIRGCRTRPAHGRERIRRSPRSRCPAVRRRAAALGRAPTADHRTVARPAWPRPGRTDGGRADHHRERQHLEERHPEEHRARRRRVDGSDGRLWSSGRQGNANRTRAEHPDGRPPRSHARSSAPSRAARDDRRPDRRIQDRHQDGRCHAGRGQHDRHLPRTGSSHHRRSHRSHPLQDHHRPGIRLPADRAEPAETDSRARPVGRSWRRRRTDRARKKRGRAAPGPVIPRKRASPEPEGSGRRPPRPARPRRSRPHAGPVCWNPQEGPSPGRPNHRSPSMDATPRQRRPTPTRHCHSTRARRWACPAPQVQVKGLCAHESLYVHETPEIWTNVAYTSVRHQALTH